MSVRIFFQKYKFRRQENKLKNKITGDDIKACLGFEDQYIEN